MRTTIDTGDLILRDSRPFEWACKPMGIRDLDSLKPACLGVLDPPTR